MILVDSSVWIDFFRGVASPQTDRLDSLLGKRVLAIGDLILVEILQGLQSEREAGRILQMMLAFEPIDIAGAAIAVEAARNYRTLRGRGITVRKTIDVLIATRCIVDGLPLLHSDRDFEPFVTHLGLRSAMDED